MFIIPTYTLSVCFCVVTMICWGSWANTQKLAERNWRFELFYWDYVLGIVAAAILIAFTLGSSGSEGRSFLPDLRQAGQPAIVSALEGGVIFNLANILLAAAISIAGMAVAFPIGIGLALVIGVVINYVNFPLGNPVLLASGVMLIVLAIVLNALAYNQQSSVSGKLSVKGLALAVISGCLMGLFYKYVAAAMFLDFQLPVAGKLSPYTAVVIFSAGVLGSNFLFNSVLMRKPFAGKPVSYADYFRGSLRSHSMGLFGGMIWCIGMAFSIIASDKAGTAISYGLGQGATVIAALWGIYVWKEFKGAGSGVYLILNLMLILYLSGLMLLIAAR